MNLQEVQNMHSNATRKALIASRQILSAAKQQTSKNKPVCDILRQADGHSDFNLRLDNTEWA